MRRFRSFLGLLLFSACLTIGCSKQGPRTSTATDVIKDDNDKVLNLYIWADDMAPDTLSSFEQVTGIKVHVSYFDSPETLESRMLTGNIGFDVVVPTAAFIQRHI
ncbi:MAG: polyamine ABC transporter substrate-binding protein, partial [Candidatus Binataceae bacterium]